MKRDDAVKKVCEILGVKHSHYDDYMNDIDYFPHMELQSPVRLVAYPGMSLWTFAILQDMTVITPSSRLSILAELVYDSLDNSDECMGLREKYTEMITDVRDELKRLKEAKEFLINSNFQWEDIPKKI